MASLMQSSAFKIVRIGILLCFDFVLFLDAIFFRSHSLRCFFSLAGFVSFKLFAVNSSDGNFLQID